MELDLEFTFSAAHHLPRHPGKCLHVHGHNYRFRVTLEGEPDPYSGMIMDFGDIQAVVREQILSVVDHRDLNEFLENPTAENLVVWFWERLEPHLPGLTTLRLWEMDGASVTYRGRPGEPRRREPREGSEGRREPREGFEGRGDTGGRGGS